MAYHGEADFNVEDFDSRYAGDKSVYVKFYIRPYHDEAESVKEGRPIYRDREYVEIRTPGNQTNIVNRPVTEMDRNRFKAAYKEFKSGELEQVIGTPLTEVPWITRSQVEELSYLRIRTLEHLSGVGDDVCTRIPGLFKLKQRAVIALEKAEKSAPFIAMQKENEDLRASIASLDNTVREQAKLLAAIQAEQAAKVRK